MLGEHLDSHLSQSPICADVYKGRSTVRSVARTSADDQPKEHALRLRAGQRLSAGLTLTTTMRLEKLTPGTHVQGFKEGVLETLLPVIRRHLQIELTPHTTCSAEVLKSIVHRCTDLFGGIETSDKERTALLGVPGFELIKPVKRELGVRNKVVDGQSTAIVDFCWDLPADKTISRLFRKAPNALAQVLAFQKQMHLRAHQTEPEVICYVDVHHGSVYRDHEVLGDAARRANPTHQWAHGAWRMMSVPLTLSCIAYYDDVEPANSLGYAKVIHKLGCFYLMLIDLEPSTRNKLQFILPFTLANAKDVGRYGKAVLVGDPSSEAYGTCTSFGATCKRMSNKAPSELKVSMDLVIEGSVRKTEVELYLIGFAADYPAAAMMGFAKRSTAARFFDRRSFLDSDGDWKLPNSFLVGENMDLAHRWELRTLEGLRRLETEWNALKGAGKAGEAADLLMMAGINDVWNFDYGLRHFDYFDEVKGTYQDAACPRHLTLTLTLTSPSPLTLTPTYPFHCLLEGTYQDAMHTFISSGICSTELGGFLYLSNSVGAFVPQRFNEALKSHMGGSRIPPVYESITEGQAGGLPSSTAKVHWSASQMLHFMPGSVRMLTPLVEGGVAAVRQKLLSMVAAKFRAKRAKLEAKLEDYLRAWESWKALHAVTDAIFAHSFTPDQVIRADRLTYAHHTKFREVHSYMEASLWKPKQNFSQLVPFEISYFGPPIRTYCMMFEMMNQVMKRYATTGDWTDVSYRSASMWDLCTAWHLATGKLAGWSPISASRQGDNVEVTRSSAMASDLLLARIFERTTCDALVYSEVFETSYVGQSFELGTWVLAEEWTQFLRGSSPQIGFITRMVTLETGALHIELTLFPVSLSDKWSDDGSLVLDKSVLVSATSFHSLIDSMALTIMRPTPESAGDTSSQVTFTVQRSALE
jgi:hypothetical protein